MMASQAPLYSSFPPDKMASLHHWHRWSVNGNFLRFLPTLARADRHWTDGCLDLWTLPLHIVPALIRRNDKRPGRRAPRHRAPSNGLVWVLCMGPCRGGGASFSSGGTALMHSVMLVLVLVVDVLVQSMASLARDASGFPFPGATSDHVHVHRHDPQMVIAPATFVSIRLYLG